MQDVPMLASPLCQGCEREGVSYLQFYGLQLCLDLVEDMQLRFVQVLGWLWCRRSCLRV